MSVVWPEMLSYEKLDRLERQLGQLRVSNQFNQHQLQELFDEHSRLLNDYTSLRHDFEEQNQCGKHKGLARGPVEKQFVLVIVDGNSYIFNEHLLKAGHNGGIEAARLLLGRIELSLKSAENTSDCRIVVRVFANQQALSRLLAQNGLVGNHARAIAPFVAAFNQSQLLFDFVDTGDDKVYPWANPKVEETFHMFAATSACERIIFAGCSNPQLVSLFEPYRGRSNKITLIKSAVWAPEYDDLGLSVEEYTEIFRSTPMPNMPKLHGMSLASSPRSSSQSAQLNRKDTPFSSTSLRFASSLTDEHEPENSNTLNKSHGRFFSSSRTNHEPHDADVAFHLPVASPRNADFIPINGQLQRLDTFIPKASAKEAAEYHERFRTRKICNEHHLKPACRRGTSCQFDHSAISEGIRLVLKAYNREHPCIEGWACRTLGCYYGHVCIKDDCRGLGQRCRLTKEMHNMDLEVAQWVAADSDYADGTFIGNAASMKRYAKVEPQNHSRATGSLAKSDLPRAEAAIETCW